MAAQDSSHPIASALAEDGVPSDIETSIERRRAQRSQLVVRVRYSTVDALFSEFTRNINEGGVFIATDRPAELGTRVSLEFELPGGAGTVRALGRVAWTQSGQQPGPDRRRGMGVEFEELDRDARERINEFVRRLRSPT